MGASVAALHRRGPQGYERPEDARAYFRGAIFDRSRVLEAKGEGDMYYIFHTSMEGAKGKGFGDGHVFKRDVHGGGGHGGWGSHARMAIYEELVV